MKFRVTLKDADAFDDQIEHEAQMSVCEVIGIPSREKAVALAESRANEMREAVKTWVQCDGCFTLEFDTDGNSARLVPWKEDRES